MDMSLNIDNLVESFNSTVGLTLPGMNQQDAEIENSINPRSNYTSVNNEVNISSNAHEINQINQNCPLNPPVNQSNENSLQVDFELETRLSRYWRDGFGDTDFLSNWPQTTVLTEEEDQDDCTLLKWFDDDFDDYIVPEWKDILKNKINVTTEKFKTTINQSRDDFLRDTAKKTKILPLDDGEELIYKETRAPNITINNKIDDIIEKIKTMTNTLNTLKEFEKLLPISTDLNSYIAHLDFTKSKWFGFNINEDLAHLWELVDLPLKFTEIYSEEEVQKQDISVLLGYLSEICVYTKSKQAIFFVKFFSEGSRQSLRKNKKGFSEYKRTFGKVLDHNDKKSYGSVCKMLANVLNVKCAFKNKYNMHGCKSSNPSSKEALENSGVKTDDTDTMYFNNNPGNMKETIEELSEKYRIPFASPRLTVELMTQKCNI